MIIIVEGIDRVGKTTLCNRLSEELNIPIHKYKGIVKYDKMKNKEETDKTLGLIQLLKETGSSIIFDRSYMSDYVYGILQRNYKALKANKNFELVNNALYDCDKSGNKVCIILVNPIDINESSKEHGVDLTRHYELFNIIYDCLNDKNFCKKIICNYYNFDNVVNLLKMIKEENDI